MGSDKNLAKTTNQDTAFTMLKADHTRIKQLFKAFKKASTSEAKAAIVADALDELKLHTAVEEQLFYPALRLEMVGEDHLIDEADEEHHVMKILVAELGLMQGNEDYWEAKFSVLAQAVRRHIKEEEKEIFPKAKQTDIDFHLMAMQIKTLKQNFVDNGLPQDTESEMVRTTGLRGESPSKRKAGQNFQAPLKVAS